jgi:glycosyltransferase involved in cell wall biosynthesis
MKSKIRIALVSNTAWSMYNFRLGLLYALRESGFEVTIIAPRDSFSSILVSEGFSYEHLPLENYSVNPIAEINTVRHLIKIYKKIQPDLIFHYTIKPNIYGSFAAKWCGIPSVAVTTGLGHLFSFKGGLVRWLTVELYRIAAKWSKSVWFLNQEDKKSFLVRNILPESKMKVIPGEGINIQHFSPIAKADNKNFTFLFAGRLLLDKGVVEFAEAARLIKQKYPRVNIEILGFIDPENPNAITYDEIDQWQNEGLLSYLGEASDVRIFLGNADCLVFPSYYGEGVSRILLEASSMQVPIITTDQIGCRDVVQHGENGLLVPIKSKEALFYAMEEMLLMPKEAREKMGEIGRRKILEKFDENLIIQIYLEEIKKILPLTINNQREKKNVSMPK